MFVGVDVGGTKLEAILIEKSAQSEKVLNKIRTPTERDKGYEHILKKISDLIVEVCGPSLPKVKAIGLGLPGSVDPRTQIMILGNTHALENKPLTKDLLKKLNLKIPVYCENDANCFALAEVYMGAGKVFEKEAGKKISEQTAVGVILGTGVGGGIVVNGHLLSGRRGAGGEIGHTTLHEGGHPCYCDRHGCAEQYLSGTSVENNYLKMTGIKTTCSQIFPTPEGTVLLENYKKDLGAFLGNLTNVLDPDYFVLGGGVSRQPGIYKNVYDFMKNNLFIKNDAPKVYKHIIGDSSGSLGAAMVAWKNLEEIKI